MKKILVFLFMALALSLSACTSEKYELALVTDYSNVDDKSFNQGAWEGVQAYAEENDISHKYYRPTEQSATARLDAIGLAVKGGAEVVVCPGFAFGEVVFEAQTKYPDTKFILLDATPHSADWSDFTMKDNVHSIFYAEEQGGFLAGYSAVKDGYTELGFMGGIAVPAVIRYGYGFVQGAEYAAQEMGVNVNIMYNYVGGFDPKPEIKTLAASWYNDGTELIFSAGGGIINSISSAATETSNKFVIGVDVDQRDLSDSVLSNALKMLSMSVSNAIEQYYNGEFGGGQVVTLDAAVGGVALTEGFDRYNSFTQADYDAILAKLISGEVVVGKDDAAESADQLNLERTTVTVVE